MVHPRLDRRGGAENLIEGLSRALAARGHEVSVAALRYSASAWPEGAWAGCRMHRPVGSDGEFTWIDDNGNDTNILVGT